jgi:broad specificity phosphatase PhoE
VEAHDGRFHAGWNEAKSDANYSAMVSKRDHPLTPQGVAQARGLNDKWRRALGRDFGERPLPFLEYDESGYLGDKDDANCLERVDVVWASPLTRALQTALIGFHGFPPLRSLALHASCREVKNVGGFDSVGLATGSYNILQRCEKKLAEAVGQPDAAAQICNGLACDARDAAGEWWLPSERREGKRALDRRAAEFLREVQYETLEGHCQAPLVVSHSHFIRGLFKRYRDAADVATKPFSVKKLANCGVVAVDIVFDDATGGAPSMRNPRLLFGSALEGDDASEESSEDESGSRLERAKNFGSGVLSSIEKRVRPARSYANTPDTGSVDLLTGDDLDGPLFAPVAPCPPPRAAPSESFDDGSLI